MPWIERQSHSSSSYPHSYTRLLNYIYWFIPVDCVWRYVLFEIEVLYTRANNFHSFFNLKDCCLMFWTHGELNHFFSSLLVVLAHHLWQHKQDNNKVSETKVENLIFYWKTKTLGSIFIYVGKGYFFDINF